MKYFLAILFLSCFSVMYSQNESLQKSKWKGEISFGLGSAELKGEAFEITGNVNNVNTLLFYKLSSKGGILTGVGVTHFNNGALLPDGYSRVKATFIEIPFKLRGYVWNFEQTNIKFTLSAGFQFNKAIKYHQKINSVTFEPPKTDWYVDFPLEIGVEIPLGKDCSFGIYSQNNYFVGNKTKKYIMKNYNLLKLSLIYNF